MAGVNADRRAGQDVVPVTIRPREWMKLTGMSVGETYRQLYNGNLKAEKVGRAWYVRYSELTDFFDRMRDAA